MDRGGVVKYQPMLVYNLVENEKLKMKNCKGLVKIIGCEFDPCANLELDCCSNL